MLDTIAIVCNILMLTICSQFIYKERSRIVSLLNCCSNFLTLLSRVLWWQGSCCQMWVSGRSWTIPVMTVVQGCGSLWVLHSRLSVKRIVLWAPAVEAPGRNVAHILKFMGCVIVPHWTTHSDVLNMSYLFSFFFNHAEIQRELFIQLDYANSHFV